MVAERVFVGRARELEQLGELADAVDRGAGMLALISGEAGIGKTRLAARVAAVAEARGFRVTWGRCWEAGGAPAYYPWAQVFAGLALTDPFGRGDSEATDPRELRFRQYEAATALLVDAARTSPIAVLLDDLHAADLPSLAFLQALARGLRSARLLVIGTFREVEGRTGEAGALLAKIARDGELLALPRLSRDETTAWIRQVAPATSDADAARVCDAADGNPLFVHELLRGHGRLDPRRLPAGLASVIAEQLARMPNDARATLAAASVLGRELAVAAVAALEEGDDDRVASHLAAACDVGVLEPVPDRPDAFAFSHVLVRDQLYAQLTPSRRAALHWRAGEHAADASVSAHHLMAGAAAGDVRRAAEAAHDAAIAAFARLAFEDALALATRARELVGRVDELACRLELLSAEALMVLGEPERGQQLACQVADAARALGSAKLLARAGLVYGTNIVTGRMDPVMVQLLRDGLAALGDGGDDRLRASVMARLATALTPPTPETLDESVALARKAYRIAQGAGDARTQVRVGFTSLHAVYYRVPVGERDAMIDGTVALATAVGDELVLLGLAPLRFGNLRERGRPGEADHVLDDYAERVRAVPRPGYLWRVPMLRATRALLAGELAAAEELGDAALAIARHHGLAIGELAWAQHRVALAMASGDPTSIGPVADRVLASRSTALASWTYAATGRHDEARAMLRAQGLHSANVPTVAAVEAALLIGDRELVEQGYGALAGLAEGSGIFWGGPPLGTALGPFARTAADLAAFLGHTDDARRLYDRAIDLATVAGAVPLLALARRGRDALGAPATAAPAARGASLVRTGDHWTLAFEGRPRVLKARRGFDHLARLLAEPRRELHVLELAGDESPSERGAPVLDAKAKAAYRARIAELREVADGADGFRADAARTEIDAIAHELSRALGLGGRDRTTATAAERARAAVTLAIRRAIEAIAEHEPTLAGHLETAIRTGIFCTYRPDPRAELAWDIKAR